MARWLAAVSLLAACSGDAATCDPVQCTPLYEPTFDNIYERTLVRSCATGGGACHASDATSGLSMANIDDAYDGLTRYTASSCATLGDRLTSANPNFQMPPGKPLPEGETCAILQWAESGAPR